MKFKNKTTGNILETKNEKAIELMRNNPDRYEVAAARKPAKSETTKEAKD